MALKIENTSTQKLSTSGPNLVFVCLSEEQLRASGGVAQSRMRAEFSQLVSFPKWSWSIRKQRWSQSSGPHAELRCEKRMKGKEFLRPKHFLFQGEDVFVLCSPVPLLMVILIQSNNQVWPKGYSGFPGIKCFYINVNYWVLMVHGWVIAAFTSFALSTPTQLNTCCKHVFIDLFSVLSVNRPPGFIVAWDSHWSL